MGAVLSQCVLCLCSCYIVDDDIGSLATCRQVSAIVGEIHGPDFSLLIIKLGNGSQRKLASIADMVREQGGWGRRIMIETLRYLGLFDLVQENGKAVIRNHG